MSSTTAWLNDDLTTVDQSMAALSAPNEFCQGISEVPSTIQCDPWCSAARNRQVQSSDVLSGDHALAKRGVMFSGDVNSKTHMLTNCRQSPYSVIPNLDITIVEVLCQTSYPIFHVRNWIPVGAHQRQRPPETWQDQRAPRTR